MQRVVGVYAQRRQLLVDKAAAGDEGAAWRLAESDKQRQGRYRLRQRAANGDMKAMARLDREAWGKVRWAAADKAKRESGDPDAVVRYEAQKWKNKERAKEKARERATKEMREGAIERGVWGTLQVPAYAARSEAEARWVRVHSQVAHYYEHPRDAGLGPTLMSEGLSTSRRSLDPPIDLGDQSPQQSMPVSRGDDHVSSDFPGAVETRLNVRRRALEREKALLESRLREVEEESADFEGQIGMLAERQDRGCAAEEC